MRHRWMRIRVGFTLVELLVVVAIIAILVGLIFTAGRSAMEKSRQAKCMSNLHLIYQAIKMYREDYKKAYPPPPVSTAGFWQGGVSSLYPDYTDALEAFRCPNDKFILPEYTKPADEGGPQASTYNGWYDMTDSSRLTLKFIFYNYYGYSRSILNADGTAPAVQGWLPQMMTFQEWDLLDGQQDGRGPVGRDFPALVDRNAPPRTIITICPWHRNKFGKDLRDERFIVLRLDGTAKTMKWLEYNWVKQPNL